VLQAIPSWVLRRAGGTVTATAAVFGPGNVWVFSVGAGSYAAHYNGRTWAKVPLPEVPAEVSVAGSAGVWALGAEYAMHWTGASWARIPLTRIPGTRSLWATGTAFNAKGNYGVILKYDL
jgi:hypothetical protein